jgi:hypothetical protein
METIFSDIAHWWSALPAWPAAGITLVVGWALAFLARFVIWKFLVLVRFEKASEKTGMSAFLRKGNVDYTASKLLGAFAYWIILIIVFFKVAAALDIRIATSIAERLEETVPGLVAGAFIIIIGIIFSAFLANFLLTVMRNAAMAYAEMAAKAVKYVGVILVVTLGIQQIDLGKTIIGSLMQILFAAVVFGIALAFGLGCKDMAREVMQRFLRNIRERDRVGNKSDLEG